MEEKGPLLADSIVGNKLFSLGCSGNLEEEVDEIGSLVGFALVGDSLLIETKGWQDGIIEGECSSGSGLGANSLVGVDTGGLDSGGSEFENIEL